MSECEACGKPHMTGLKFRVVDGKLLCGNCAKGKYMKRIDARRNDGAKFERFY